MHGEHARRTAVSVTWPRRAQRKPRAARRYRKFYALTSDDDGPRLVAMPKATVKALRVLAAHLLHEAELLQSMAREALAESERLWKSKSSNGPRRRTTHRRTVTGPATSRR
jgi:hypothetical protein